MIKEINLLYMLRKIRLLSHTKYIYSLYKYNYVGVFCIWLRTLVDLIAWHILSHKILYIIIIRLEFIIQTEQCRILNIIIVWLWKKSASTNIYEEFIVLRINIQQCYRINNALQTNKKRADYIFSVCFTKIEFDQKWHN